MNLKKFFAISLSFVSCLFICNCVATENTVGSEIKKDEIFTLKLEGTRNTRDLGVYKTLEGKNLGHNLFFRSDNTSNLSDLDIEKLKKEYDLRYVIDLRSVEEVSSAPDKLSNIEGIKYYNIPVVISKEQIKSLIKGNSDLGDVFIESLNRKDIVKKIFDTISSAEDGSVLFHCTNGKNRTGIVAALLLGLNGVSKEDIISDYSALCKTTNNNNLESLLEPKAEHMKKLLKYIESEFGNIKAYLLDCGVSEKNLNRIENKFQKSVKAQ